MIIAAALIFNSDRWLPPLLLRSFNRSSVRWLCREDGGIITTASYSAAEATLRLGECGNAERQKKDVVGWLAGQGYCPEESLARSRDVYFPTDPRLVIFVAFFFRYSQQPASPLYFLSSSPVACYSFVESRSLSTDCSADYTIPFPPSLSTFRVYQTADN